MRWAVAMAGVLLATSVAADTTTRIAFGSCANDDLPDHPIWDAIAAVRPDAFLMIGDNVYADTPEFERTGDPALLEAEYAKLAAGSGFRKVASITPVFATWDDHDYGINDGGADFPLKRESERVFEDFWGIDADAPERHRPGVYAAKHIDSSGGHIQLLMLDTRYFRSPLVPGTGACRYRTNDDGQATILGAAQWQWLEEQLRQPADLRVIATSIQAIPDEHCWERWGAMPHERERLFQTIATSGAKNVLLVSGDRHLGEISRLPADAAAGIGYPLFEITSSPLSAVSGVGVGETNRRRMGDNVRVSNFGLIAVDWPRATATLSLVDASGRAVVYQTIEVDR